MGDQKVGEHLDETKIGIPELIIGQVHMPDAALLQQGEKARGARGRVGLPAHVLEAARGLGLQVDGFDGAEGAGGGAARRGANDDVGLALDGGIEHVEGRQPAHPRMIEHSPRRAFEFPLLPISDAGNVLEPNGFVLEGPIGGLQGQFPITDGIEGLGVPLGEDIVRKGGENVADDEYAGLRPRLLPKGFQQIEEVAVRSDLGRNTQDVGLDSTQSLQAVSCAARQALGARKNDIGLDEVDAVAKFRVFVPEIAGQLGAGEIEGRHVVIRRRQHDQGDAGAVLSTIASAGATETFGDHADSPALRGQK
ncbi:MAG: hypothetical protein A2X40_10915 [Elusimicrobia bacterium GWC2_65_9]|nr:MAG: hypothetical protein A2X40_10915 [Elusimicrobia bacterium GWC2_65_9]